MMYIVPITLVMTIALTFAARGDPKLKRRQELIY